MTEEQTADVIETTATPISEENVVQFDKQEREAKAALENAVRALNQIWDIFCNTPNLPVSIKNAKALVDTVGLVLA